MSKSKAPEQVSELEYNEGRPSSTVVQDSEQEVTDIKDWSKTFHVDSVEAFVNGILALNKNVFIDFINTVGKGASIGATSLYQAAKPLSVRFEIKKIGVNEFQIRGAHFSTEAGVNICVGLNPQEPYNSYLSNPAYFPFYYYVINERNLIHVEDFLKNGGSEILNIVNDLQSDATNITKENFESLKGRINEVSNRLTSYLLLLTTS